MINGAKKIIDILYDNGHTAYMVGGCVRDIIMNNTPFDYDITTSATPLEIINIFKKTIPTGLKHGTVTVIMDSFKYEVTTFRIDGEYKDNRKPKDVTFSKSLIEDVKRRDFTINSICYNDKEGYTDYFDGIKDINKKIIRTVNNPYERFTEDALRILRGIRFAAKFGFEIEENTFLAMKELMPLVKNISGERIFEELSKMFEVSSYNAAKLLFETNFFKTFNLEINSNNIEYIKNFNSFETVFSILTFDKKGYELFLNRLKCSNKTKSIIKKIHKSFDYSIDNKIILKKMLNELKCEDCIEDIIKIHIILGLEECNVKELYAQIIANNECFSLRNLKINGNDLLQMNIAKEKISYILNYLLEKVIEDNNLNNKNTLLKIADSLL